MNSSPKHAVPAFGLGTFRLQGQAVMDSVRTALALGYRAIDTAQVYGNEADIGQAIAEAAHRLLVDADLHTQMAFAENPYGDGRAAHRIVHGRETVTAMPA